MPAGIGLVGEVDIQPSVRHGVVTVKNRKCCDGLVDQGIEIVIGHIIKGGRCAVVHAAAVSRDDGRGSIVKGLVVVVVVVYRGWYRWELWHDRGKRRRS